MPHFLSSDDPGLNPTCFLPILTTQWKRPLEYVHMCTCVYAQVLVEQENRLFWAVVPF